MRERFRTWFETQEQSVINKVLYHGTSKQFEQFEIQQDLGIHAGTFTQAVKRLNALVGKNRIRQTDIPIIYEVSVTINNPLRLHDCNWSNTSMIKDRLL